MQKVWRKDVLLRHLLQRYEKDVEPPVDDGESTIVKMGLSVLCVRSDYGHTMINAWANMVSRHDGETVCLCSVLHG